MDRVSGTTLVNPSGLDATVFGVPSLTRGIQGNAIETNGRDKYIRVSGPGHRFECFGDLDKCPNGRWWCSFINPCSLYSFIIVNSKCLKCYVKAVQFSCFFGEGDDYPTDLTCDSAKTIGK